MSGDSRLDQDEELPYRRGQDISQSQLNDEHPHISLPLDFEHFLHVGAKNLGDVNVLCKDQQRTFEEVVARRTRRLPKPPETPMIDESHTNKPTPRLPTGLMTPQSLSRQSSSSSQHLRNPPRTPSTRLLRSFMRGDTPKKKGKEEDAQALVAEAINCIEDNNLSRLNQLLESDSIDVNACDADGHTLLDLAVMLNQIACIKLLQLYGGVETEAYVDPKVRERRLEVGLRAKQIALGKILDEIKAGARNLYQEHEQNRIICERSVSLYRKWHRVFRSAGKPAAPRDVRLYSTAPDAVTIRIGDVLDHGGAVVTKYKVLWSEDPTFESANHVFVPAVINEFTLNELPMGKRCYVRVASFNLTGVGPAVQSTPPFVVPSSWREVDQLSDRVSSLEMELESAESKMVDGGIMLDSIPLPKKLQKFGQSLKLSKPTKRGLYIAVCLFDRDNPDSVLTAGSGLPCVLVDEHIGAQDVAPVIQFVQLLSFSWSFARHMAHLSGEVSSLQFRRQAAECVACLQQQTGIVDLGYLYYQPVIEKCGATTIVACCGVQTSDIKTSLSWSSRANLGDGSNLSASVSDFLEFGQGCSTRLTPGLYLASVFPHNTVSGLRVSVPKKQANMLPCKSLRRSSHLSKDEWLFIRNPDRHDRAGTATHGNDLVHRLVEVCPGLLAESAVDAAEMLKYRLYTKEILEVRADTSILVLVPSEDYALETTATAQAETRQHTTLAAKSLELLMWQRFQPDVTRQYARLWLSASSQVLALQYSLRKALGPKASEIEHALTTAKDVLERIEAAWQQAGFFTDIIRWTKDASSEIPPVTVGDLKKKVRVQPEAPQGDQQSGTTTESHTLRLAMNIQGKGILTVYAQSPDDAELLIRHKVAIPQLTPASRVVKTLIEELNITSTGEDTFLCLVSGSGQQKRIADGCRPLLMQVCSVLVVALLLLLFFSCTCSSLLRSFLFPAAPQPLSFFILFFGFFGNCSFVLSHQSQWEDENARLVLLSR
eukprot:m.172339 g.172339  ORF g.172339 m.172339 type:complete len:997 (-) comp16516_c4_seq1:229-3219(-)